MSRVYLARDSATQMPCVVKELLQDKQDNPIAIERFIREAEIASLLIHPRIARVTDAGEDEDGLCLVMELVVGVSLADLINRVQAVGQRLPVEAVVTILLGALEGLAYAHDATDPKT